MPDLAYPPCGFNEYDNNTNGGKSIVITMITIVIMIITMATLIIKIGEYYIKNILVEKFGCPRSTLVDLLFCLLDVIHCSLF